MSRSGAVLAALTVVAALAGCGSQLDPEEVRRAQAAAAPGAAAAAVPGTPADGSSAVEDDGVSPVVAPGGPGRPGGPGGPGGAAPAAEVPGPGAPGDPGAPVPSPAAAGEDPATPSAPTPQGACDGFRNGDGITDSTIRIGNVADVSGPQPGIFEASQDAVRAFVAYFNATSDVCGRSLELTTYDSRTDGVAEQQAYAQGCDQVFAMIGSMSAFDASGAATAAQCGLPDLRTTGITPQRLSCRTCFGALSSNPAEFQNAVPDFVLDHYGDAGKHAAMLYINIGAAPDNAKAQVSIFEKRGMHFDYVQAIDISEFNYAPYAQAMRERGIEYVQMIGSDGTAVRLAQAMQQAGFEPALFMNDPSVYKPAYAQAGGTAVEGTVVFLSIVPFEEAARNAELRLYEQWLDQVRPGAAPTFFGVYAWSAARLFVEQAVALGGRLDRASLVRALARVDGWTAHDLHAPQRVGPKRVGECNRFVTLRDGAWVPLGGTSYQCSGTTLLR